MLYRRDDKRRFTPREYILSLLTHAMHADRFELLIQKYMLLEKAANTEVSARRHAAAPTDLLTPIS